MFLLAPLLMPLSTNMDINLLQLMLFGSDEPLGETPNIMGYSDDLSVDMVADIYPDDFCAQIGSFNAALDRFASI